MKIVIKVFGRLLDYLPRRFEMELEEKISLQHLISKRIDKFASSIDTVLHDPQLTILINGRNILTLVGFDTILQDGDTVSLMPLVVGG